MKENNKPLLNRLILLLIASIFCISCNNGLSDSTGSEVGEGEAELNSHFGKNGFITGDVGDAQKVTIDSNANVLVAGRLKQSNIHKLKVWRYKSDGTLDTEFGDNGSFTYGAAGEDCIPNDIKIADDGTIFIAGMSKTTDDGKRAIIISLTESGIKNNKFNNNGIFKSDRDRSSANALSIGKNGNLYIAGSDGDEMSFQILDSKGAEYSLKTYDITYKAAANAIYYDEDDGTILLAGYAKSHDSSNDGVVLKLIPNDSSRRSYSIDGTFARGNGFFRTFLNYDDYATSIAVDSKKEYG